MYLKEIKAIIDNEPEFSTDYFLKTHRSLEGYFNRLIFIGLRINVIKYADSQKIIRNTFLNVHNSLEKGLCLLEKKQGAIIFNSPTIKSAYKLFLDFSVRYRNKIEHAVLAEIRDELTLETCINTNIYLLREIEYMLNKTFQKSAFDKPTLWGAKKSFKNITDQDVKSLKLGSEAKEPIKSSNAFEEFKKIKWVHNSQQHK